MECWPITTTSRMDVRNTHTSVSETCQFAARRSQNGGVLTSLRLCCVSQVPTGGLALPDASLPTPILTTSAGAAS